MKTSIVLALLLVFLPGAQVTAQVRPTLGLRASYIPFYRVGGTSQGELTHNWAGTASTSLVIGTDAKTEFQFFYTVSPRAQDTSTRPGIRIAALTFGRRSAYVLHANSAYFALGAGLMHIHPSEIDPCPAPSFCFESSGPFFKEARFAIITTALGWDLRIQDHWAARTDLRVHFPLAAGAVADSGELRVDLGIGLRYNF